VVLFAARRIAGLSIERLPPREAGGGFRVSGRLPPGGKACPVLLSGLALLEPELWLPETGRFVYVIPEGRGDLYHRLGYRDASGELTISDAFYPEAVATSSPETGPQ
jgi:hypothetical protein